MTVLLTGWSGPAVATARGWSAGGGIEGEPTHPPGPEISYTLTRDRAGIRLAAAGATFSVRKTVLPDGSTDVAIECEGDVVSIAATHVAVVVTRGDRSVTVNVNGGHDAQLGRVRALLLGSAAARAARTLATVLEESGTDALPRMGLRLTGALLAQMDGDEGAVRRLSRELQTRYARSVRRLLPARTGGLEAYQAGVTKAATDLETCLESFSFFNPMRQVCSFVWVRQVERLWCAHVAWRHVIGSAGAASRSDWCSSGCRLARLPDNEK